ncbi:MAG TPA: hypothetical protein VLA66_10740 [Thermoanaerobaculia bacterium]|nr:hypothetical protein [Thermoanaerobaculia bacterium]
MSTEPREDFLRAALLEGDDRALSIPQEDLDRIHRALDGELSAGELDALLARVTAEPALARAWRLARELRAGLVPNRSHPRQRPSRWLWGSVAATALVAALLVVAVRIPGPGVEREPAGPRVTTAIPDSAKMPRTAFRLTWRAVAPGARYTVEVLDQDFALVDRAADLEATEYTVPAVALERLASESLLYWRVEAFLPDGERLASPTFVQTLD